MATTPIAGSIKIGEGTLWFGGVYDSVDQIRDTFTFFKENNVSIIINLLDNKTIADIEEKNFHVVRLPIEDFSIPKDIVQFRVSLEATIQLLKNGHNMYVHCFGGHGRTGLFLAAIKVLLGDSVEDALKWTKENVKGPETREQENFISDLAALMHIPH